MTIDEAANEAMVQDDLGLLQPEGEQVVAWYKREIPFQETMLYTLAYLLHRVNTLEKEKNT